MNNLKKINLLPLYKTNLEGGIEMKNWFLAGFFV